MDVVGQDIGAAFGQGVGLGGAEQHQGAVRGNREPDARVLPGPVHEAQDVFGERQVHRDFADLGLQRDNVRAGDDRLQGIERVQLLEWKLIAPGDLLYISTASSETAVVKDDKQVIYHGQPMTYTAWGQKITGWSAINIYEWTIDEKTKKSLDDLRREKAQEIEQAALNNPDIPEL